MSGGGQMLALARSFLKEAQPAGEKWIRALCPFHRKPDGSMERHASFYLSCTGGWICHACHEHGNLRALLRSFGVSYEELDGDFREMLEEATAPLRLDPLRPNLFTNEPIPESLLGLFHYLPVDLEKEGFTEETLAHFDVGFDREHMRITYPLRDVLGRLIGISGRTVVPEVVPRYKIYDYEYKTWGLPIRADGVSHKRAILWNADQLYPSLRSILYPRVVLVEGFKALMWVYQAGVHDVVALLGSYMSEEQQWILEHVGSVVYLMLDRDLAGQKGTLQIGDRLAKGLDVYVVEYRKEEEFGKSQPSDLSAEEIYAGLASAEDFYIWKSKNKKLIEEEDLRRRVERERSQRGE